MENHPSIDDFPMSTSIYRKISQLDPKFCCLFVFEFATSQTLEASTTLATQKSKGKSSQSAVLQASELVQETHDRPWYQISDSYIPVIYPSWFHLAIEHDEIIVVDLPIFHGDFPHLHLPEGNYSLTYFDTHHPLHHHFGYLNPTRIPLFHHVGYCRFEILFANWGPPARILVDNVSDPAVKPKMVVGRSRGPGEVECNPWKKCRKAKNPSLKPYNTCRFVWWVAIWNKKWITM